MKDTTSRTELQDALDAITTAMAAIHDAGIEIPYPKAWHEFGVGKVEYPDVVQLDIAIDALERVRVPLFKILNRS